MLCEIDARKVGFADCRWCGRSIGAEGQVCIPDLHRHGCICRAHPGPGGYGHTPGDPFCLCAPRRLPA